MSLGQSCKNGGSCLVNTGLIANRHNDDDVKLMGWLMTGARHGTVDVCGENLSVMKPVKDFRCGIRPLTSGTIDNNSKLLKMQLKQQDPHKIFSQDEKGFDEKNL